MMKVKRFAIDTAIAALILVVIVEANQH